MFLRKTGVAGALALVFGGGLPMAPASAQGLAENAYPVRGALEPVVVTATRFEEPLSASDVVVSVIRRDQIETSGVSNVVELLDQVPGLFLSRLYGRMGNDARVDIGFMGENAGNSVLVLIDGFRINNIDNEEIRYSQIPISSVDRVEIRTAGAGVLYGDRAVGGVINIITRQTPERSVTLAAGDYGYRKLDVHLASGTDERFFSVSAMSAQSNGYRDRTKSDNDSVRVGFRAGSAAGNFLSLQIRAFDEKAELPGGITLAQYARDPRKALNYNDYGERRGEHLNISTQYIVHEDLNIQATLGYETSDNYGNLQSATPPSRLTRSAKKVFAQPMIRYYLSPGTTVRGGLDLFSASVGVSGGEWAGQDSQAGYVLLDKTLTESFSTSLGIRRQGLKNEFRTSTTAPTDESRKYLNSQSLSFSYILDKNAKFRFGFVDGFRFPTANELYFFGKLSPYSPTRINPGVEPMTSKEFYAVFDRVYGSGSISLTFRTIETKGEIGFSSGAQCSPPSLTEDCNKNLYDTKRNILTGSLQQKIAQLWRIYSSIDFVDSDIKTGTGAGKKIPLVPTYLARVRLDRETLGGNLMLNINYRGSMYQTDYYQSWALSDPGYKIPSRILFDLGYASARDKPVSWNIWLRNAANKKYYDFGRYGSASYGGVYPGDARTLEASFTYRF